MQQDFSIVIPTLNSEKFLSETLDSIKKQDQKIKIECIFSDGGSKDATLKIINNFSQNNIKKILLYNQVGMSKALNEGFRNSNGKYLFYLNSDDKLASQTLKVVKENFENNSEINWIIGNCENFGDAKWTNKLVNKYKRILLNKLNFSMLSINNIIPQPSVYWRAEFFRDVGIFDEKLKYNMDYDLWLRMITLSKPKILNMNLSYFRRHSQSLSHKNTSKQFYEKFLTMRKYNKNIFIKFAHIFITRLILIIYFFSNY